jgi:hypothetical protein
MTAQVYVTMMGSLRLGSAVVAAKWQDIVSGYPLAPMSSECEMEVFTTVSAGQGDCWCKYLNNLPDSYCKHLQTWDTNNNTSFSWARLPEEETVEIQS